MAAEIPDRSGKVHFMEVLHALAGKTAGVLLPLEEEGRLHEKLLQALPIDRVAPKFTAGHFFAALYVQAAVRGL